MATVKLGTVRNILKIIKLFFLEPPEQHTRRQLNVNKMFNLCLVSKGKRLLFLYFEFTQYQPTPLPLSAGGGRQWSVLNFEKEGIGKKMNAWGT